MGIEQLLERRVNTAVLRCFIGDGTGHADGRGSRDEYQRDHRDCKGQFHGTPPGKKSGTGSDEMGWMTLRFRGSVK
ncbi:hypothetical protein LJR230_000729 [Trinickia sp. LjRoot230]|uniref:hypothetical protein n=1 Tax=Trinickia sp. LjRoot230 TaxID=3342288 RepID=UPI003ED15060